MRFRLLSRWGGTSPHTQERLGKRRYEDTNLSDPRGQVCKQGSVAEAFNCIGDAIAAYESTPVLLKFSAKYDAYLAGTVTLSEQELTGLWTVRG